METQPYFCGNQLVQKNCSFFCAELCPAWTAASPFPKAHSHVCRAGAGRMPPPRAPLSACTVPCAFPGLHTPSLAGAIPQIFQLSLCSCCSSLCLLSSPPWFSGLLFKEPQRRRLHTHSTPWTQQSHGTSLASEGTTCCLAPSLHDRQVSVKFSLMLKIAAVLKRELMGLFCPCLQHVLSCRSHFVLSTLNKPKELQQKVTKVQEKG